MQLGWCSGSSRCVQPNSFCIDCTLKDQTQLSQCLEMRVWFSCISFGTFDDFDKEFLAMM